MSAAARSVACNRSGNRSRVGAETVGTEVAGNTATDIAKLLDTDNYRDNDSGSTSRTTLPVTSSLCHGRQCCMIWGVSEGDGINLTVSLANARSRTRWVLRV